MFNRNIAYNLSDKKPKLEAKILQTEHVNNNLIPYEIVQNFNRKYNACFLI